MKIEDIVLLLFAVVFEAPAACSAMGDPDTGAVSCSGGLRAKIDGEADDARDSCDAT